jgi:hypothetical protein
MTQKKIPFAFVLDYLYPLEVVVKPMFGLYALYVNSRIVLMLRDKKVQQEMNGVWIATSDTHHASLKEELPSLAHIAEFSDDTMQSGWLVVPAVADDFESSVMHICDLIKHKDPRIGKTPVPGKPKSKH